MLISLIGIGFILLGIILIIKPQIFWYFKRFNLLFSGINVKEANLNGLFYFQAFFSASVYIGLGIFLLIFSVPFVIEESNGATFSQRLSDVEFTFYSASNTLSAKNTSKNEIDLNLRTCNIEPDPDPFAKSVSTFDIDISLSSKSSMSITTGESRYDFQTQEQCFSSEGEIPCDSIKPRKGKYNLVCREGEIINNGESFKFGGTGYSVSISGN